METATQRATTLRVIGWLVERHHQSLGLWPWTWPGLAGEPYVTLYAACAWERFGEDFAALASWVDASRWPPPDGTPFPATLRRDCLRLPDWALGSPLPPPDQRRPATLPDLDALARAGASLETLAQLLESGSTLDDYLALLAPQRHGGHRHRSVAGQRAVVIMRLATEMAIHLGEDYAVPWAGPSGGRAGGIADPDWPAFQQRYQLSELPFPPNAAATFAFGERGWLHADGWAGDRHGTIVRIGPVVDEAAYAATLAIIQRLLGHD